MTKGIVIKNLLNSVDPNLWAREFMNEHEDEMSDVSYETMKKWFGNAILVGHDLAIESLSKEKVE